jgi:hypothetical protein
MVENIKLLSVGSDQYFVSNGLSYFIRKTVTIYFIVLVRFIYYILYIRPLLNISSSYGRITKFEPFSLHSKLLILISNGWIKYTRAAEKWTANSFAHLKPGRIPMRSWVNRVIQSM